VPQSAARLKEAAKLGFARAVLPEAARGEADTDSRMTLSTVGSLVSLVAEIAKPDDRRRTTDDRWRARR
jgi:DNA repair protein RadA/Sms